MKPFARHSLRSKVMWVVVATTAMALLLNGAAMLFYEVNNYRNSWVRDLKLQADIIGQSSKSALAFNDPKVAAENLEMLKLRPDIDLAVIYRPDGQRFASYHREGTSVDDALSGFPIPGLQFTSSEVILGQSVSEGGRVVGQIVLRSRHDLTSRLVDYLLILAAVMGASLGIALLLSYTLQRTVTDRMLEVARLARQIMGERDYRLRANKVSEDEVGELVDAFNGMLQEVDSSTSALEASNQHLRVEMAERHRAEEALKDAMRAKDAFLATLAHELRNPLAPISTAVEVMTHLDDGKVSARQSALAIMRRQVHQLVRLIDDLLDVSRISTGKLMLKIEQVDLLAVLCSAEETAAPLLAARGHTLIRSYPEKSILIAADHVRLAQVFANLLNNAAKYTPPGGRVQLAVEVRHEAVTVRVIDNGIGIAPELQSAVFDLFFQANQSIERGNMGLGLGLTLSRQLVELHGGSITLHSDGLGEGAAFTVVLPLGQVEFSEILPSQDLHDSRPRHAGTAPLEIVIADDNHDFVASLCTLLEACGHRVSCTYSGTQAYEMACEVRPDLVLLDIGMGELNGYELAAKLRGNESTRSALLVAVTGWGQPHDRLLAQEAGMDVLLVKPIDLAALQPLLDRASQSKARGAAPSPVRGEGRSETQRKPS